MTDACTGGLIYMQARYYDPGLGRFVSEDTGRNGTNWFAYCSDDPVNYVDSTGKSASASSEFFTAVGYGFTVVAYRQAMSCDFADSQNSSALAAVSFAYAAIGLDTPSSIPAQWIAATVAALAGGLAFQAAAAVRGAAAASEMPGGGFAAVAVLACAAETVMLCGYIAADGVDS